MADSKELWLTIDEKMHPEKVLLGRYTTQAYIQDPIRMSFITSRYKFCSRLLSGKGLVIEIGCGDGFGGSIVAQSVGRLVCTDINEALLKENSENKAFASNISTLYPLFRIKPAVSAAQNGVSIAENTLLKS